MRFRRTPVTGADDNENRQVASAAGCPQEVASMRTFMGWALASFLFIPVVSVAAQDTARGEQLYGAQKCQMCHQIAGKGNKLSVLDGVGAKLTADQLREWVVAPDSAAAKAKSTKKPAMPKTYAKLPPADIDALVAYLQTLK
jgi:mono/diheme cytochrome c family protein